MSSYITKKTPSETTWFTRDRFGMFIHWGIYSLHTRRWWIRAQVDVDDNDCANYFEHFNPDLFDAKEWARQAKAAGMKYVVLTAKSSDGFCLYNSQYTDFKATNTKAGRDLLRESIDAFRAEGLRIGLYYSLIDWHHPEYTIDSHHPKCVDESAAELNKSRDMKKYCEYMRNQVRELLTEYGTIDIMWLDSVYPSAPGATEPKDMGKNKDDFESDKLIALIRALQPNILINDRAGIEQDFRTVDQIQPDQWIKDEESGELVNWVGCQTLSGSWFYDRDKSVWKNAKMLIEMLIDTVGNGGNLLMNVGPTARGEFDAKTKAALDAYAEWMRYNSCSIYGCTMAEPEFLEHCPTGCKLTQSADGKRLYLHLVEYPFRKLPLVGMKGKMKYVQFVHDGSELIFRESLADELEDSKPPYYLALPEIKPDVIVPVIEITLE